MSVKGLLPRIINVCHHIYINNEISHILNIKDTVTKNKIKTKNQHTFIESFSILYPIHIC